MTLGKYVFHLVDFCALKWKFSVETYLGVCPFFGFGEDHFGIVYFVPLHLLLVFCFVHLLCYR